MEHLLCNQNFLITFILDGLRHNIGLVRGVSNVFLNFSQSQYPQFDSLSRWYPFSLFLLLTRFILWIHSSTCQVLSWRNPINTPLDLTSCITQNNLLLLILFYMTNYNSRISWHHPAISSKCRCIIKAFIVVIDFSIDVSNTSSNKPGNLRFYLSLNENCLLNYWNITVQSNVLSKHWKTTQTALKKVLWTNSQTTHSYSILESIHITI